MPGYCLVYDTERAPQLSGRKFLHCSAVEHDTMGGVTDFKMPTQMVANLNGEDEEQCRNNLLG